MRLVCPNCGAQYEIADDLIPTDGRDVQCSNCGHAWFEQPGASVAAEDDPGGEVPPIAAPAPQDEPEDPPEPEVEEAPAEAASPEAEEQDPEPEEEPEPEEDETPEPEPEEEPEREPEPDDEDAPDTEPEPDQEQDRPPRSDRRSLDPAIAEILREEAEREEAARRAESEPLETQPDLGLDDAESLATQRAREARERVARLRGESQPQGGPAAAAAAAAASVAVAQASDRQGARDRLPDIEEINSTLQATGPNAEEIAAVRERQQAGGFRRGFMVVVVVALLATILYIVAPNLIGSVPALEPVLKGYVDLVDGLRLSLFQTVQGFVESSGGSQVPDGAPAVPSDPPATPEPPQTD